MRVVNEQMQHYLAVESYQLCTPWHFLGADSTLKHSPFHFPALSFPHLEDLGGLQKYDHYDAIVCKQY